MSSSHPPSITDEKSSVPTTGNKPFADIDSGEVVTVADKEILPVKTSLRDADEALAFLQNHPRAAEITAEGAAILEDEETRKKLLRKIDWTITPLLAGTYFLQFLDKNTLSYTSVMGMREDTGLKGQQYSHVSMLFYIGECGYLFCMLPLFFFTSLIFTISTSSI